VVSQQSRVIIIDVSATNHALSTLSRKRPLTLIYHYYICQWLTTIYVKYDIGVRLCVKALIAISEFWHKIDKAAHFFNYKRFINTNYQHTVAHCECCEILNTCREHVSPIIAAYFVVCFCLSDPLNINLRHQERLKFILNQNHMLIHVYIVCLVTRRVEFYYLFKDNCIALLLFCYFYPYMAPDINPNNNMSFRRTCLSEIYGRRYIHMLKHR
jgi:hypothetical protein